MCLNTFKNTFKYFFKKIIHFKNKRKISEYSGDNAKMVINFYVSIKTIIALSFVYYTKKYDCKINKE